MRIAVIAALSAMHFCSPASAAPLQHELAGMSFLLGTWVAGSGVVADTGGTSRGTSTFTAEAGGAVLLRRDHTDLSDKAGKPAGGFDQIMFIYADGGAIHADYFDGTHAIHYLAADIVPGQAVTFTTGSPARAPQFRLGYALAGAKLSVDFTMAPPGQARFVPVASGSLRRAGRP